MRTQADSSPTLAVRRVRRGYLLRTRGLALLIHLVLIAGSIIVLIPLAWMLSTSLKDPGDVFLFPPKWIPDPVQWGNYQKALTVLRHLRVQRHLERLHGSAHLPPDAV